MKKILPIIVILILVLGVSLWHRSRTELHSMQLFLMDTIVEIQAQGDQVLAQAAMKGAFEELGRVDSTFGYQDSLLKELNSSHSIDSREFYDLVRFSLTVHRESLGAFSLTLRPILDAWGFSGTHPYRVPTEEEFEHWRSLPSDSDIVLLEDGRTVQTREGSLIDLGGVAKGYAADNAARVMREKGVAAGLINAGGDIMSFGDRTWQIGIKHPRAPGTFAIVPIRGRAIATSGDYERFFLQDHRRYCHILDPATGWPAQRYMSTTIVADSCAQADAWATALFVNGLESLQSVLKDKGMEWIVIDLSGTVSASKGLREYCPDRIEIQ